MKAVVWHSVDDILIDDVSEPKMKKPTDAVRLVPNPHTDHFDAMKPRPAPNWRREPKPSLCRLTLPIGHNDKWPSQNFC